MDADLQKVNEAVEELRHEVKAGRPDSEKMDRINDFLSDYEEKFTQPIIRAQEEAKNLREDFSELKEKMEKAGATHAEARERVDALELELATRHAHQTADDPHAYREGDEYKALNAWSRAGEGFLQTQNGKVEVSTEQKALLRTDINGDGGYLVPEELDSVIVKKITEVDPIRSIARVRTIQGKAINLPIRDSIPVAAYEAEAETGTDSASGYINEMVTPFRQTFTTPVTLDMLQDGAFDMESEILGDSGEAFAFGEGQGFVTGTGVKEPAGFTQNATLTTIESVANPSGYRASGAAADFTLENLIDLTSDLKVGYDPVFVMNRRTLARIRKFRGGVAAVGDAGGEFLWQPGLGGPADQQLLGFRYILANSMPDIASDAFPIAFGDFRRGYTIVDRTGLAIIRDDVTLKKTATVEFTMHRWNTAQVTLAEPLKLLKLES
jgi:HK97 family phage major capsid protein